MIGRWNEVRVRSRRRVPDAVRPSASSARPWPASRRPRWSWSTSSVRLARKPAAGRSSQVRPGGRPGTGVTVPPSTSWRWGRPRTTPRSSPSASASGRAAPRAVAGPQNRDAPVAVAATPLGVSQQKVLGHHRAFEHWHDLVEGRPAAVSAGPQRVVTGQSSRTSYFFGVKIIELTGPSARTSRRPDDLQRPVLADAGCERGTCNQLDVRYRREWRPALASRMARRWSRRGDRDARRRPDPGSSAGGCLDRDEALSVTARADSAVLCFEPLPLCDRTPP